METRGELDAYSSRAQNCQGFWHFTQIEDLDVGQNPAGVRLEARNFGDCFFGGGTGKNALKIRRGIYPAAESLSPRHTPTIGEQRSRRPGWLP